VTAEPVNTQARKLLVKQRRVARRQPAAPLAKTIPDPARTTFPPRKDRPMRDGMFLFFFVLVLSNPVLFVGFAVIFQSLQRRRVERNRLFRCLRANPLPAAEDSFC
jgi:hypothetical protein